MAIAAHPPPTQPTTLDGRVADSQIKQTGTISDILIARNLTHPMEALNALIVAKQGKIYSLYTGYHKYDPEIEKFAVFGFDDHNSTYLGSLDLGVSLGHANFVFSSGAKTALHWLGTEEADFAYQLLGTQKLVKYGKSHGFGKKHHPFFDERLRWIFARKTNVQDEIVAIRVYAGDGLGNLNRYVVVDNGNPEEERVVRISPEPPFVEYGQFSYGSGINGGNSHRRWRETPGNPNSQAIAIGNIISELGYRRAILDGEIQQRAGYVPERIVPFPPKEFSMGILSPHHP